jgi:hypothetical protein
MVGQAGRQADRETDRPCEANRRKSAAFSYERLWKQKHLTSHTLFLALALHGVCLSNDETSVSINKLYGCWQRDSTRVENWSKAEEYYWTYTVGEEYSFVIITITLLILKK